MFQRRYSLEAYTRFCLNLREFLDYQHNCPGCHITSVFDQDFDNLGNLEATQSSDTNSRTCQDIHCYAYSPFPILDHLPTATDHRVLGLTTRIKDQEGCGSCWSFGQTSVLENALLLDQKKNSKAFWTKNARELDLSEQFFLRNTYGFQKFCSGGDAVMALNYMAEKDWPTVEVESNCKYDYHEQGLWRDRVTVVPRIKPEDYYVPYRLFPREELAGVGGTPMTPVIKLADASFFNQTVIMSYLARGVAVLGAMNTAVSKEAQRQLSAYNGRYPIQNVGCNRIGLANHQIVFIGYGTFKGVDVWLVKNSWGKWGNHGCFYIRRGRNDYCIENYAYAVVSKYLEGTEFDQNAPFTSAFPRIERGEWGLDRDDGTYNALPRSDLTWVWIMLGCFFGLLAVAAGVGTCVSLRRRRQRMLAGAKFHNGYDGIQM